jgi:GT2 family glycosyltransferase
LSNLSIVIPVYNEDETCELFVDVLEATVKTPHEVIIVYDSLNDTTIPSINNLKKNTIIFIQYSIMKRKVP